jgi:uncharacterized protein YdcH (DUF465 family)|tara:strand:- start:369 stop:674 length:306 start_codon:yes stop_codon:yes gene_type:complete
MKLEKVGSLLKKFDVDIDSIKDDFEAAMEEEVIEIKKEVGLSIKDKILYYIDDEKGKKEVVDKVNKAIDIPLLTESMEEKIFTAFFNVLGGAIKKVLNKII